MCIANKKETNTNYFDRKMFSHYCTMYIDQIQLKKLFLLQRKDKKQMLLACVFGNGSKIRQKFEQKTNKYAFRASILLRYKLSTKPNSALSCIEK